MKINSDYKDLLRSLNAADVRYLIVDKIRNRRNTRALRKPRKRK